ncbi:MAG: hypothetical protein G3M78_10330 [Candidatus Nitrohelix vancouverensis]|uniref:Alkylmercury lyase n=1 Tax=Candidatus Nitrohelix vancouverensis TaxID=2705534 RepID=A0A7T0G3W7_9BACT|nr:MAG: hypothetical protein G3M78_10330 [Candidatus Nitrohelix vancouverensis]
MKQIELVFDRDCPNVDKARHNLREALALAGLSESWKEWDRSDAATPADLSRFGSPTVLVDGVDIAESPEQAGNNCRVYSDGNGRFQGAPAVEVLVSALNKTE